MNLIPISQQPTNTTKHQRYTVFHQIGFHLYKMEMDLKDTITVYELIHKSAEKINQKLQNHMD